MSDDMPIGSDFTAETIVHRLLEDPATLPPSMSPQTFEKVCAVLRTTSQERSRVVMLIVDGTAYAQFPALSSLRTAIDHPNLLPAELLSSLQPWQVSKPPSGWLLTILAELRLLGLWGIVVSILVLGLLLPESTADVHDYLALITQLLGVTFVLYGLVKTNPVLLSRVRKARNPDFLMGHIGKLYNDDWATGVAAVSAILLSLFGLLLSSPAIDRWDTSLVLSLVLPVWHPSIHPVHFFIVCEATITTVVLVSFFHSIAIYYWSRSRGETLRQYADAYFESEYKRSQSGETKS